MRDKLAGIIAGTTNCPTDAAFRAADAILAETHRVGWSVESEIAGVSQHHGMENEATALYHANQYPDGKVVPIFRWRK